MQTPYGSECPYFYGDYFRGKNHEECRLLGPSISAQKWTSKLCNNCPVPGISRANACEFMKLSGEVSPGIFGLGKSMKISAFCAKSNSVVKEPHIGCGICHPLANEFLGKK